MDDGTYDDSYIDAVGHKHHFRITGQHGAWSWELLSPHPDRAAEERSVPYPSYAQALIAVERWIDQHLRESEIDDRTA